MDGEIRKKPYDASVEASFQMRSPGDLMLSQYYGQDKDWWLERVKWYNVMTNSSVSESMVEEFFSVNYAMRSLGANAMIVNQLYTIYEFWQEHGGLEDFLCSS